MFAEFLVKSFKKFGMRNQALNLGNVIASKSNKVFYAVGRGKETGVYESWNDCWVQINKFPNAKFRKFNNPQQAEEFVNFWKKHTALAKESIKAKNEVVAAENTEKLFKYENPSEIQCTTTKQPEISPQLFPSSNLQVLSSYSNSVFGKIDLKNIKSTEENLTLDSFKTVFDGCFKEICAISSAVSSLKLDVKKIKETLDCNFLPKPIESFEKNEELQEISNSKNSSKKTKKKVTSPKEIENETQERCSASTKKKISSVVSLEDIEEEDDVKKDKVVSSIAKIKKKEINPSSFLYDNDGYVKVFTDGSVLPRKNGEKGSNGGVGVWFGENHPLNLSMPIDGAPTNNLAEIQAARVAIQMAIKAGITQLKICTDSSFLINCATRWIFLWKKKNWILSTGEPVKHKKELQKLSALTSKIKIKWEKVPGHAGIKGNESADRLANKGCLDVKLLASNAVNSGK